MTLAASIDALRQATAAADELGLGEKAGQGRQLIDRITERLGFPGEVYVLALAGGTGVGKSSVLNALAEKSVSPARALRPTTEMPVAWVAETDRRQVSPLLDWLGVHRVVGHELPRLDGVVILDLPDFDSIRLEHRLAVDALLPRIDAVAWVVDPEKYDDERLHTYLRSMVPHRARMRFILNKADRLRPEDHKVLTDDLRQRLATIGLSNVVVDVVSAVDGSGIDALRADLSSAADAKAIVVAKAVTDVRTQIAETARVAGVEPETPHRPLLDDRERAVAVNAAVEGALTLVDLPGVERQVHTSVSHRASRQGGSLLARILSLLAWATGTKRRRADPGAYLRDWRQHGSLGLILNPVRSALVMASAAVPAPARPALLSALGARSVEVDLTRALDRSTREAAADLQTPSSVLWPVLGFIQLLTGAVLLFAIAWYLTVIFGPAGLVVTTVDFPYLGPVPMPLVLVAGSLVISMLLGFVLRIHAGWIGRRLGRKVVERVKAAVTDSIVATGFAGIDRVDDARRRLAHATLGADADD
ncbi:MAG: GTPase [Actinomycetota bacterium]